MYFPPNKLIWPISNDVTFKLREYPWELCMVNIGREPGVLYPAHFH